MSRLRPLGLTWVVPLVALLGACTARRPAALLPEERFHWVREPIAFSPPPGEWERQGDNGGGTLGVRFILRGGGGQCISVAAFRQLAERDRSGEIARLAARWDSLSTSQRVRELLRVRSPEDAPISERESAAARAVNLALDRAATDELAGRTGFVASDLAAAARAATGYQPTLAEVLPHVRLRPERMQEPDRWRTGIERDTVLAGHPAFATDDTLITPEDRLLYHEVFWVVDGCAFKATFQGRPEQLALFHRVVDSITFPEASRVAGP